MYIFKYIHEKMCLSVTRYEFPQWASFDDKSVVKRYNIYVRKQHILRKRNIKFNGRNLNI